MDARAWTWMVVLASFAMYLVVLVWLRVRSAGAFYRPAGRVRPLAAGVAVASGWITAASYLSLGGVLALSAPDGAVYLVGWLAGFALLALLVAPYLRRSGRHTIPQLVAERFGSRAAGAVGVACALLVTFTYLAAQLRGAALVLSQLLPLSLPAAVAAAAAGVLLYTALGRLRALTGGQVAQYLVLAAAFSILGGALLFALTGTSLPQAAPWARLSAQGAALLGRPAGTPLDQALESLSAGLGLPGHAASARPALDRVASVLSLVAGTAALPHIVGRFLVMSRASDARASALWALAFIALFYSAVPAVALGARAAFLARGAAGAVDPDQLVLAAPALLGLPPWVVAVAVAGALAAAVSAAAGLVLSLASAASRDLLRGLLLPGLSERAEERAARLAAAGLTALAAWLAVHPPGSVVQTVALAFGLAAAAFFPALLAVVGFRRATRAGVLWGMVAGALFTIGYVHWFRFAHPELDGPAHWWLGISPEGIGAVGALLGGVVLVGLSLLSPAPARAVPERPAPPPG